MSNEAKLEKHPGSDRFSSNRQDLSEDMLKGLSEHLQLEFQASYNYLGMAAYFEGLELKGFASWFHKQSSEEKEHAMKVKNYLQQRSGPVQLPSLEGPVSKFSSILHAFEAALENELMVSAKIKELYGLAQETNDINTIRFLSWFVDEQMEEEDLFNGLIQKIRFVENSPSAILMLDHELGKRD